MNVKINDLQLNQVLEMVKALVSSKYFEQYDIWHEGFEISYPPIQMKIGGRDKRNKDWFKVRDAAPYLDLLIKDIEKEPNSDFRGHLTLHAPYDMKRGFGFSKKAAEELDMYFYAMIQKTEKSSNYTFEIYNGALEEGSKKDMKNHNKWRRELDIELEKIIQCNPKMPVYKIWDK